MLSVNLGQPALMAFGLSGSLSACFMYIFALLCVSTEWQIKMLACLLAFGGGGIFGLGQCDANLGVMNLAIYPFIQSIFV